MNRDSLKLAVAFGLILIGLILAGCGESRSPYVGTYQSLECFPDKKCIELDLKEDGKGSWILGGKGVEFTWVVNDGKLWFYIKGGAILIATPNEGGKKLSVDMTSDWHPGCPPNACVTFKRISEGG